MKSFLGSSREAAVYVHARRSDASMLAGYNPDGHKAATKSERKADTELDTYQDILGGGDTRPNHGHYGDGKFSEKSSYDKELSSYDNILSFGPAHGGSHKKVSDSGDILEELNHAKKRGRVSHEEGARRKKADRRRLPKTQGDDLLFDEWQVRAVFQRGACDAQGAGLSERVMM